MVPKPLQFSPLPFLWDFRSPTSHHTDQSWSTRICFSSLKFCFKVQLTCPNPAFHLALTQVLPLTFQQKPPGLPHRFAHQASLSQIALSPPGACLPPASRTSQHPQRLIFLLRDQPPSLPRRYLLSGRPFATQAPRKCCLPLCPQWFTQTVTDFQEREGF